MRKSGPQGTLALVSKAMEPPKATRGRVGSVSHLRGKRDKLSKCLVLLTCTRSELYATFPTVNFYGHTLESIMGHIFSP
jgi:glutamyl-tRNA reductase